METSAGAADEQSASSTEDAEIAASLAHRKLVRRSRFLSAIIYFLVKTIYRTMRMVCENMDRSNPSKHGVILVTWHGRTAIPACVFEGRGCWALISLSRDGELQNGVFSRFGFQTIRGSTGRGGVRGALQMARKVKEGGVLAFTPDGPRGPTHKVQPGVILMAQKSGAPIVPLGVAASRSWQAKSWDSYMIPKPFSRGYVLLGDPIFIPPSLSELERDAFCTRVEVEINRLEKEAERRAGHPDYPAAWPTELPVNSPGNCKMKNEN